MKKYIAGAAVAIAFLTTVTFALAGGKDYTPVPKTADTETGYIEGISGTAGNYVLSIDAIDWYEGDQAKKIFQEREGGSGEDGPPDGYYIVNDDPTISRLPISPKAEVVMQIYDRTGDPNASDTEWNESITLDKFVQLLQSDDELSIKDFPYHLTVKGGKIVRIVQQFIP
ncbi:hypothetical protein [Paenibacillus protaetiae]|uniref:Uncharacterized protein n=1 Tax=Paenibacillus protaetiae TaxID=2509456 RepID=A0A4P6EVC9_9BACL|nr:hypothetical protein [Paenibacillus protaetiae]QAY66475.1 hypothetical protein ET464_08685 [Paenibacillus protaetiae]